MSKKIQIDEVLSIMQRRKRGMLMKRIKNRIAIARRIAKRKMASKEKLIKRSRVQARNLMAQKLVGKKMTELSPSEKVRLSMRLDKLKPKIEAIAKRRLRDVRKAEIERLARERGKSSE